jgi:hypothetical protein
MKHLLLTTIAAVLLVGRLGQARLPFELLRISYCYFLKHSLISAPTTYNAG